MNKTRQAPGNHETQTSGNHERKTSGNHKTQNPRIPEELEGIFGEETPKGRRTKKGKNPPEGYVDDPYTYNTNN